MVGYLICKNSKKIYLSFETVGLTNEGSFVNENRIMSSRERSFTDKRLEKAAQINHGSQRV